VLNRRGRQDLNLLCPRSCIGENESLPIISECSPSQMINVQAILTSVASTFAIETAVNLREMFPKCVGIIIGERLSGDPAIILPIIMTTIFSLLTLNIVTRDVRLTLKIYFLLVVSMLGRIQTLRYYPSTM